MSFGVRRTGKPSPVKQGPTLPVNESVSHSRLRHHQIGSKGEARLRKAVSRLCAQGCHCYGLCVLSRLCSHRGMAVAGMLGGLFSVMQKQSDLHLLGSLSGGDCFFAHAHPVLAL